MKQNPFLITGYHSPAYFCDREHETGSISNALLNERNLTLLSPRRMGKTGLIHHAFHRMEQNNPDNAFFYTDIFSTQNLGEFVKVFAGTVLGKIDSASQKTLNLIGKFIKNIRPVFTLDEFSGAPKISIELIPGREETSLLEIFAYLQATDKKCYIAIDEFQQIAQYPEKGVEALLRSHIQFLPNVNFIFSGSKRHVMNELFLSAKRPFYQSTQILSIDKIEKANYYRFAADFFFLQGKELSYETFSTMYDEFNGHTWYIQTILNRLYSHHDTPDDKLVNQVISEIIAESGYIYESLLSVYSASNIQLLKAIAKEKCVKEINAGDFITRHNLKAASSVNTSLKKLIDKEMIYKSAQGYIVYDRFMALWIRQQIYKKKFLH
jgi:hypothetical protein